MTDSDLLHKELNNIVKMVGPPLERLKITPMLADDYEEYLARLSFHVVPSYLPFASDDSGVFCVYSWPGTATLAGPIVQVPTGGQDPRFVCDSFRTLPAAMWLWVSAYFDEEPLRRATDELAKAIPEADPVPDVLWNYLQD